MESVSFRNDRYLYVHEGDVDLRVQLGPKAWNKSKGHWISPGPEGAEMEKCERLILECCGCKGVTCKPKRRHNKYERQK